MNEQDCTQNLSEDGDIHPVKQGRVHFIREVWNVDIFDNWSLLFKRYILTTNEMELEWRLLGLWTPALAASASTHVAGTTTGWCWHELKKVKLRMGLTSQA